MAHKFKIVVATTIGQQRCVVDCTPLAMKDGVRAGQTLSEAHALCRGFQVLEHDPLRDRRALEALGRWLMRFTPAVSVGWIADDDEPPPPAVLLLDLTGCERYFGGIARLADLILERLQHFRVPARLAIAPTIGAAWGFVAGSPKPMQIIDHADVGEAADALSVRCLRISQSIISTLEILGLQTIGHLRHLPRKALPARFGPTLGKRLGQLVGEQPEVFVALTEALLIETAERFDESIESQEMVQYTVHHLLKRIVADLTRWGRGARRMEVIGYTDRAERNPVTLTIPLSRPTRQPKVLTRLLDCAIEQLLSPGGFFKLQLRVPLHERVRDEQIELNDDESAAGQIEVDRLIERIRIRLGEPTIAQPALVQSHLPERAWKPAEDSLLSENAGSQHVVATARIVPQRTGNERSGALPGRGGNYATSIRKPTRGKTKPRTLADLRKKTDTRREVILAQSSSAFTGPRLADYSIPHASDWSLLPASLRAEIDKRADTESKIRIDPQDVAAPEIDPAIAIRSLPRPIHLLPKPIEIAVVAEPSNDCWTCKPIQFSYRGQVKKVAQALGPERIANEWWRGRYRTRDYYQVESTDGSRQWMFRVVKRLAPRPIAPEVADDSQQNASVSTRWFLQGTF